MIPINNSPRIKEIEQKYNQNLKVLFYKWHWKKNLKHREISEIIKVPRPTITRWFRQFKIPTQSFTRFTNLNLLNTGPRKGPRAKPKIKKEFPWKFNKEFFNKWSLEMAYVLGFLFADGHVFINPRGSCYFGFTSTDKGIIYKIRKVLESNHKVGVKKRRSGWKTGYVLQIGNKDIFTNLKRNFGIIPNKSLVIEFPKIPKEFFGDFLRGYFDGDGCVSFGKYWRKDREKFKWEFTTRFISGSKSFLLGLQNSLNNFVSGGYFYKKNRGYELVFSRKDSVALYNLMYNNVSTKLFLERKYSIFRKAFTVLKINADVV